MTRARCWNLRLNLDTFNAAFAALDDPPEQAEFLVGLSRGMNGGKVKDNCSDPMSVGFAIGEEMRAEAEGFRDKSVQNGAKRKSNKNDLMVDHTVDQKVDLTGTQSTIHNPQSTNQKPARTRKPKKDTSLIPEDLLPKVQKLCSEWPSQSLGEPGHGGAQNKQELAKWTDPVDLWDRWREWWPDVEPAVLAGCGLAYLDSLQFVEDEWTGKKYPKFCYAMRNFYGKADYWKLYKGRAQSKGTI